MGLPDVLDADSFLVCEVITPAGNWSSWPPHKHDEERPGEETELEEIYYVETRSTDPRGTDPVGLPARLRHRRTRARSTSLAEVRTGDVVLVPHGWHGPAVAAPTPTSTTSTSWPAPGRSAPGGSATTRPTRGSATTWADEDVDPRLPVGGDPMTPTTVRLTVAQATVRFLAHQWSERDGERQRLFAGCLGIFGHGNVAGHRPGPARRRSCAPPRPASGPACPTCSARNEQAMVHTAVGYAQQRDRLSDLGRARHRSARARPTCSPGPRSRRSTASRCSCCPRAPSPPGSAPRCSRSSSCRTPPTSRSTTPSARCRASSTRSTAPSSCPPRCSARCGCSPTRSRPVR